MSDPVSRSIRTGSGLLSTGVPLLASAPAGASAAEVKAVLNERLSRILRDLGLSDAARRRLPDVDTLVFGTRELIVNGKDVRPEVIRRLDQSARGLSSGRFGLSGHDGLLRLPTSFEEAGAWIANGLRRVPIAGGVTPEIATAAVETASRTKPPVRLPSAVSAPPPPRQAYAAQLGGDPVRADPVTLSGDRPGYRVTWRGLAVDVALSGRFTAKELRPGAPTHRLLLAAERERKTAAAADGRAEWARGALGTLERTNPSAVTVDLFQSGAAARLPRDPASSALRWVVDNTFGRAAGALFGLPEGTAAERENPAVVHEVRRLGLQIDGQGRATFPNTREGGRALVRVIMAGHEAGSLDLSHPGANALAAFLEPARLRSLGFSDAFLDGFYSDLGEVAQAKGWSGMTALARTGVALARSAAKAPVTHIATPADRAPSRRPPVTLTFNDATGVYERSAPSRTDRFPPARTNPPAATAPRPAPAPFDLRTASPADLRQALGRMSPVEVAEALPKLKANPHYAALEPEIERALRRRAQVPEVTSDARTSPVFRATQNVVAQAPPWERAETTSVRNPFMDEAPSAERVRPTKRFLAALNETASRLRQYYAVRDGHRFDVLRAMLPQGIANPVIAPPWPSTTPMAERAARFDRVMLERLVAEPIRDLKGEQAFTNVGNWADMTGAARRLGVDLSAPDWPVDLVVRLHEVQQAQPKPDWIKDVPPQVRDIVSIVRHSRSDGRPMMIRPAPGLSFSIVRPEEAGFVRTPIVQEDPAGPVVGLYDYTPKSQTAISTAGAPTLDDATVLKLKRGDPAAIRAIADRIAEVLPVARAGDTVFTAVPSSTPGAVTGNLRLLMELKKRGYQVDPGLLRNPFKRDSAVLSGDRSLERQTGSLFLAKPPKPDVTYVVIDDVLTTGTSMGAALQILGQYGARRLLPLAIGMSNPYPLKGAVLGDVFPRLPGLIRRHSLTPGERDLSPSQLLNAPRHVFERWYGFWRGQLEEAIRHHEQDKDPGAPPR